MTVYFLKLDSLKLQRSALKPEYFDLLLQGRDRSDRLIKLRFDQLTDLEIGNVGPDASVEVSITDISHWQREEARFSVDDEALGRFSFKCFGFSDCCLQLE